MSLAPALLMKRVIGIWGTIERIGDKEAQEGANLGQDLRVGEQGWVKCGEDLVMGGC